MLFFASCANIGTPQGGPRDKEAPKLLNKKSVDSLTNFSGGKLVIDFDEYITLDNLQKNFQISPLTKQQPKVKVKKKSLIVELPDSLLEKNTTYHIDFGNAIRDVRENNQLSGFSIMFSTGSYFDSLTLNGNIFDAQTGRGDSGLVMLYPASTPDSSLLKERPLYVTKASNGSFAFQGLPNKKFKLTALQDKNSNYVYDAIGEKIAFRLETIDVSKKDSALVLYSFVEDKMKDTSKLKTRKRLAVATGTQAFVFSPNIKSGEKIDYQDSLKILLGDQPGIINKDKIRFYENDVLDLSMTSDYDDSLGIITIVPHWELGSSYSIILQKGFIKDTTGVASKADTIAFRTMGKEDYGSIVVQVDSAFYEDGATILLYEGEKELKRSAEIKKPIKFEFLKPSSYKLRLRYDKNNNGKWDSGDLSNLQQPETTLELNKTIRLKPNWENKIDWIKNSKKKRMGK